METWEGAVVVGDEEICMVACQYYFELFSTHERANLDHILSNIHPTMTEGMNAFLCKLFKEEVVNALKDMSPKKAPGEDDFDFIYKTY